MNFNRKYLNAPNNQLNVYQLCKCKADLLYANIRKLPASDATRSGEANFSPRTGTHLRGMQTRPGMATLKSQTFLLKHRKESKVFAPKPSLFSPVAS